MGAPSPITGGSAADVLFGRLGRDDIEFAALRFDVVITLFQTRKTPNQLFAR